MPRDRSPAIGGTAGRLRLQRWIPWRQAGAARGPASIQKISHDSGVFIGPFLAHLLDESWHAYKKRMRRIGKRCAERRVHRLRVAARRLLTSLDLLSGLGGDRALDKARLALERQFAALGELRDAQVQLHELGKLPLSKADRRLLRRPLERRERRLCRGLAGTMGEKVGRQIRRVSARYESIPAGAASDRLLRSGLNRAIRTAQRRALELLPRRPEDMDRLHRARIAIKRYRYLLELLRTEVSGAETATFRGLQACQAQMGHIHDLEILMARLDRRSAKGKLGKEKFLELREQLDRRRASLVAVYLGLADRTFPRLATRVALKPA